MRVTLVFPNYPPRTCGVGDYTRFVAVEMAGRGIETTVVTSDGLGSTADGGLTLRTVPGWGAGEVDAIVRQISDSRPDVVFLQYAPNAYGRAGIAPGVVRLAGALRARRIRTIVVFHEIVSPLRTGVRSCIVAPIQRAQARRLAQGATAVVVTTDSRLRTLARWTPEMKQVMHVVPVGSNIPVVPVSDERRDSVRREYLPDGGGVLIGGFGTLHTLERNFEALFEALALVRQSHPSAQLVWLGDVDKTCPTFAQVDTWARDRGVGEAVHWTGKLDPQCLSEHLGSLDVFVTVQKGGASFRHGSLLAAIGHGLPIAAFDGPERDERIVNGVHMVLVEPNARALSSGIESLLSSSDLCATLRKNILELHDSHLSWPAVTDRLLDIAARSCENGR